MNGVLTTSWMDSVPWEHSIIRINNLAYNLSWRASDGKVKFTIFHRKRDRVRIVDPGNADFLIQFEPHSSANSTMRVECSVPSIIQAQLSICSDEWLGVDGYVSGRPPLVLGL